ncbi:Cytochrome P450 2A8, partial [Bienertia sinuspersici]
MVIYNNIRKLVVTVIRLLQQPDRDFDALLLILKLLGEQLMHIKPSFTSFWWILCIGMMFLAGETRERGRMFCDKTIKDFGFNGYGYDELSPYFILYALKYAAEVGTSSGTPEEQMAFNELLTMSDVVLLTSDELLKRGSRTKWVIIKMGSKGSMTITLFGTSFATSYK